MLALHEGAAEQQKLAQRGIGKNDLRHTLMIGPTLSITCLTTSMATFHVFIVSMASSAESSARDNFVWLSSTRPTGLSPSIGMSPVWDKGAVTVVSCMDSLLDWTVGCAGLAFVDTETVKKSLVCSTVCVARPSAFLKTISNSTCRILDQTCK
jgi:hypothetical protein